MALRRHALPFAEPLRSGLAGSDRSRAVDASSDTAFACSLAQPPSRRTAIGPLRMSGPMPHAPARPIAPRTLDVARGIFGIAETGTAGDAAVLDSSERIAACVPDALARWFGPYGSLALVARALAIAEAEHPALSGVTAASGSSPRLLGLGEAVRTSGSAATAQGIVTWLAALLELLGRLIGDDLALMLLEPCAPALADASAGDPRANGRDPRAGTHPPSVPHGASSARRDGSTGDDATPTTIDS